MAYSELIKNFDKIRDYMREFYVYGFKSRDEFNVKSLRSYDDERRRIESWLGDYMYFRHSADGKNIFLSIDSRNSQHNPLYKAWKAKTFTDGDITLHFIIFDIINSTEIRLSLNEITGEIDKYLSCFKEPKTFDESTARKKLNEYVKQGLLCKEKCGKTMLYHRSSDKAVLSNDVLDFYSEVAPCGVIGSFLLDKVADHRDVFKFKHHYITSALDSEILCSLLDALHRKQLIQITTINRKKMAYIIDNLTPLKIYVSVQTGRQYLMAYSSKHQKVGAFRIDNICSLEVLEKSNDYERLLIDFKMMQPRIWGVSTRTNDENLEHVEFTVKYSDDEHYIHNRMEREKRFGQVVRINNNTSSFIADVYDSMELIPWIRTFICRIVSIDFSNKQVEEQFKNDLNKMYQLYGLSEHNMLIDDTLSDNNLAEPFGQNGGDTI